MNKQELIEKIEEVKETLEQVQSVCYLEIRDEVEDNCETAKRLRDKLAFADSDIDSAIDKLEEALNLAEELPDYEYRTTYAHMAKHIANKILCNSIVEFDESLTNTQVHSQNYDPSDNDEVFQWYLTDCTDNDVEWLTENYTQVHFYYSEILGLWVLGVYHFGTAWDYVMIDTKIESSERKEGEE